MKINVFDYLKKEIDQIFNDILEYAFLSGSYVYEGHTFHKSDLDVNIVFNMNAFGIDKAVFIFLIKKFINKYLQIHDLHKLKPDYDFPGEYIAISQIEDSINGRGFEILNNKLHLGLATNEYWLESPETWYRAWLGASAFSKFITGKNEVFKKNKLSALKTIFLYILSKNQSQYITTDDMLTFFLTNSNKQNDFGINSKYRELKIVEKENFDSTLNLLAKEGYLSKENGCIFEINKSIIYKWENSLVSRLKSGELKKSNYLLTLQETFDLSVNV